MNLFAQTIPNVEELSAIVERLDSVSLLFLITILLIFVISALIAVLLWQIRSGSRNTSEDNSLVKSSLELVQALQVDFSAAVVAFKQSLERSEDDRTSFKHWLETHEKSADTRADKIITTVLEETSKLTSQISTKRKVIPNETGPILYPNDATSNDVDEPDQLGAVV